MLTDKVALVTGGGRGIGSAIAKSLAKEGALVIINYHDSKECAQAVAEEITAAGGKAAVYGCDVADYEACGKMAEELIKKYGRIDILVNNAGIAKDSLLMKMSEKDFEAVVDTNLKGTFHTIRHLSPYFLEQRSGSIINISSVSGVSGNAGQANYSASKAGVIGLTKSVARELSSGGITCNAVAPGFIETELTEKMTEAEKENLKSQIPLLRVGSAEDIANIVTFLASNKASYITGQIICVDGGMSI